MYSHINIYILKTENWYFNGNQYIKHGNPSRPYTHSCLMTNLSFCHAYMCNRFIELLYSFATLNFTITPLKMNMNMYVLYFIWLLSSCVYQSLLPSLIPPSRHEKGSRNSHGCILAQLVWSRNQMGQVNNNVAWLIRTLMETTQNTSISLFDQVVWFDSVPVLCDLHNVNCPDLLT